jgi:hypothetical protein
MDQCSIRKSFLPYLFLSVLFFNGFIATPYDVNARELLQIAQSGAGEDDDEDEDEDC